uniref:Uncharacterized protein n=1 Tax=Arundo donax TaxID=35708 RepID=A0A0A8Y4F7_ARUDO
MDMKEYYSETVSFYHHQTQVLNFLCLLARVFFFE